jgi:hypothetical protein
LSDIGWSSERFACMNSFCEELSEVAFARRFEETLDRESLSIVVLGYGRVPIRFGPRMKL